MKQITDSRSNYLKAQPEQLAVENATVKKITGKFGALSKRTSAWIEEGIDLANDWHEVGLFYIELCDSLPGKKMTTDFWVQHYRDIFKDKNGKQIEQDQLEWIAKFARANPDGFKDISGVFAYRQQMLGAAGFELVGDAPGTTAHVVPYYSKLFTLLDTKKLDGVLKGLESDANYGTIDSWDSERKQRVFIQLEPFFKRIHEMEKKLQPIELENVK